jgi:hypothetical protein
MMTQRPPSRIYSKPLDSSFDNGYTQMVHMYLISINPRALAKNPPKNANTDLLRNLLLTTQILNIMQNSINFQDQQTHTLVLIQKKVIDYLFDHITFLSKRNWIPN